MERLERHLQNTRLRTLLSMTAYGAFVVIAFVLGQQHDALDNDRMLIWMAPLIAAVAILPRSPAQITWPSSPSAEEQDRIDMIRQELRQWQSRVTVVRLVYLVVALFTLLLLPNLL